MRILCCFTLCIMNCYSWGNRTHDKELLLKDLWWELSETAYNSLDTDVKEVAQVNGNRSELRALFERVGRRFDLYTSFIHPANIETYRMSCYLFTNIYRTAKYDLFDYYHIRQLYIGNLDYEIGYLTYQIVYKYQIILELFQLVRRRYGLEKPTNNAPIPWMIYMYDQVATHAHMVIHLCNMLNELPAKYKDPGMSPFDDYHLPPTKTRRPATTAIRTTSTNPTETTEEYKVFVSTKDPEEEEKKKERELIKKQRKKKIKANLNNPLFTFKYVPPSAKPVNKTLWPLEYGWSIEWV